VNNIVVHDKNEDIGIEMKDEEDTKEQEIKK